MSHMKKYLVLALSLSSLNLGCSAKKDTAAETKQEESTPTEQTSETPEDATELKLVEIPNAKISQGVLTGGQPTSEQYAELAGAGYTTVIDLRAEGEPGGEQNASLTAAAGMTHVRVPVAGDEGLSEQTARQFAEALSAAEGPVVVHCGSGNRVGALFGLKAFWVDGKSPEDALAVAKESGLTKLEPKVKSLLGLE